MDKAPPMVRIYRVEYRHRMIRPQYGPDPWLSRTIHVAAETIDQAQAVAFHITNHFYSKHIAETPNSYADVSVLEVILVDEHGFVAKEIL
jgi:hypothetical protein